MYIPFSQLRRDLRQLGRFYSIAARLRVRWWDWTHGQFWERLPDFRDISSFLQKYDPG